jgi:hypothetical protein
MRTPLRLLPAALVLAALPALDAAAQGIIRPPPQQRPTVGAAPALPGLAARRPPQPIEADPGVNLSPNEALFDAVSRGDLASARDAVSRGANTEARNALGLTALDTAVDQGRHEIAFFLLSAREGGRPLPPEASARAPRPGGAQQAAAAAAAQRAAAQRAAAARPLPVAAPAAPRTARLWAGDGGAAVPDMGFLGFDAGRPPGAVPPVAAAARRPARG